MRLIGTATGGGMHEAGSGGVTSLGTTGSQRPVYFGTTDGYVSTPVIERGDLDTHPRSGPLLIDEFDTTIVIPPYAQAHVDARSNLIMQLGDE